MKTSSLILSLFFVSITNAQTTFQKSFNLFSYDNGTSIEQTSDGGFIIGGYAGDTPYDIKACLIKTNAAGDINWIRYFGGSNLYYGWSARETSDGGFILSGWIDSLGSSNSNVYVVKTNVNGVLEWSKTYDIANNDRGICIRETSDAGFIICGVNWPVGFSLTILDLIKIDSTGDVEWMKNYYQTADIGFGQALYVIQTTDGGFMVTGFMNNGAGLLKTDSVGNVEWMKTYGDADWSTVAREVCQTSDGGYVAAGYTFVNFGDQDLFLFRTNASGDTLWTKTFNHGIVEEIHSLKVTSDGGIILCGGSVDSTVNSDAVLVKTDSAGSIQWSRRYSLPLCNDEGYSVWQTAEGGYVFSGVHDSIADHIYFVKTDENGNSFCYDSTINFVEVNHSIFVDSPTLVVTTGISQSVPNTLISSGGTDFTYCFVTGEQAPASDESVVIFPNPFTDFAIITFKHQGNFDFSLYNLLGQRVLNSGNQSTKLEIDRSNISSGIYFYRVEEKGKVVASGKLIAE